MSRPLVLLLALACALATALYGWRWATASESKGQQAIVWQNGPPSAITNNAAEIFKRGFWRKPGPEDKILQAERHEWSDAEGLVRWQWFLVVEPSSELLTYLRDDNVFGLVPSKTMSPVAEAPSWFTFDPDGVSILQSPHQTLRLMIDEGDHLLYATDSGRGFARGAPLPVP
jgi:hypothetical protein